MTTATTKKTNTKYFIWGTISTIAMVAILFIKPEWFWLLLPTSIGAFVISFNGV